MHSNHAMEELLRRFQLDPQRPPQLAAELRRLVEPGIVEQDGCWLLASQLKAGTAGQRQHFPDRTGYEAFVNHIHVEDELDGASHPAKVLLGQALALGHAMGVLAAAHGAFKIVVATSVDAPGDCNVRLFKARLGETWLRNDLEGYSHDGILVLETPALPLSPSRVQ
jgi:hypothetical protein